MSNITLPNNWKARKHQLPFMRAMLQEGKKRAVCIWHRRAGKDSSSLNFTAVETQRKVANYWHMLPTAVQGRHVVWDAVNPATGERVIDQVFPKEIRASINNTEMKIELKNGSVWQVVGSDNYDRLVGSNPYGVVFSEYSIADPRAWDFIRPILAENGGWAIFIYTSRGKNHGYDLYKMAKDNPDWFCELLDIEHSEREDGSPIITQEQYLAEIEAGMDPQLALQEFYCSFDAGLFGAYYTEQLKLAKIGDYPWNPQKPVHTFWDLGMRDANAIWFGQESPQGDAINIIDYEEESNVPLTGWLKRLGEKPYMYGEHWVPHDARQREKLMRGVDAIDVGREMGFDLQVVPNLPRSQGIDAVKTFLPRLRFNNIAEVMQGYDALSNYRREYNDKLRVFMDRPLHDWASNGADAMRMMAISWPDSFMAGGSSRQFKVKTAVGGRTNRPTGRGSLRA